MNVTVLWKRTVFRVRVLAVAGASAWAIVVEGWPRFLPRDPVVADGVASDISESACSIRKSRFDRCDPVVAVADDVASEVSDPLSSSVERSSRFFRRGPVVAVVSDVSDSVSSNVEVRPRFGRRVVPSSSA